MKDSHPTQPVIKDKDGTLRFRENAIVRALLARSGLTLDQLVALDPSFTPEDRKQLAQLLGCPMDDGRFEWDGIWQLLPKKGYQPQPMQPVVQDTRGVLRFHKNAIVCTLLDRDTARGRVYPDFPARSDGGLNWTGTQGFSQADEEQFAQLLGYSISGYHELSYVSNKSDSQATALAHGVMRARRPPLR
jgi:hypothetical protein